MTSPPHPPDQRAGWHGAQPGTVLTLDAGALTTREINRSLQSLPGGRALVSNPAGRHNLAVGLAAAIQVEIDGPAGFYAGGLGKEARITVNGPAGAGAGENLMSGEVHVRGSAGRSAAASARGGVVVVDGDCVSHAGISLKGATLAIGGDAGAYCGFLAQSGVILVGGDTGPCLGESLIEAVVYVGGKVNGLGNGAVVEEIDEHDVTFVKVLADGCGFDHVTPASVTKVVSSRRMYRMQARHDHGTY
ncbi:protein glxC [Sphaerisporangium melleum]|uniref:Protein glxC n=1 Tax=Sphaerisporangium melleum TaxID=321316 RepID=A0A917RIM0_9ACTN|nr:protein glxC [Sphaerisporangium melleum]GGL09614.1 protein glxC [Sphaerisporangium melleum]GII67587.1 protein glxC [Sphaerisporangium melleum]